MGHPSPFHIFCSNEPSHRPLFPGHVHSATQYTYPSIIHTKTLQQTASQAPYGTPIQKEAKWLGSERATSHSRLPHSRPERRTRHAARNSPDLPVISFSHGRGAKGRKKGRLMDLGRVVTGWGLRHRGEGCSMVKCNKGWMEGPVGPVPLYLCTKVQRPRALTAPREMNESLIIVR